MNRGSPTSTGVVAMIVTGQVLSGQVVLDAPLPLPDGTRVEIAVQTSSIESTPADSSLKTLLGFAGLVKDLPSDMARNHDHYLHGAPKS
jgi:hypothetical protein